MTNQSQSRSERGEKIAELERWAAMHAPVQTWPWRSRLRDAIELLKQEAPRPELDWGIGPSRLSPELIARVGLKRAQRLGEVCSQGGGTDSKPRIGTPEPFRDLLLSIARTAPAYKEVA